MNGTPFVGRGVENMKKGYRYPWRAKFLFLASYFFYKLILPLEVKRPRFNMWLYEILYTARKFVNYRANTRYPFRDREVLTRFGEFQIREDTADAANVSPAFERSDVNFLCRLLRRLTERKARVLFLDIGSDIGKYAVLVGRQFPSVDILCFEPVPGSVALLRTNLERNGLTGDRVRVHPCALLDQESAAYAMCLDQIDPGSSRARRISDADAHVFTCEAKRLDDLLPADRLVRYDALVFKIDVEGAETRVLKGAQACLRAAAEKYLLVEDFIDRSIVDYLQDRGAEFLAKKTDYNSWWRFSAR